MTGTALALTGVLGFLGVTGADLGGLTGRLPWTAATPTIEPAVPPRADGIPGAVQRPGLIGTDVTVLHFGVDTAQARYLGWEVNANTGLETVRLNMGVGPAVTVEVARTADPVRNRPAGFWTDPRGTPSPTFDGTVREAPLEGSRAGIGLIAWWSPGAGRYARVSSQGQDPSALTRAMAALRWDEARRCAGPVRITTLPPEARLGWCSVDVASYPGLIAAQFTVLKGTEQHMWLRYRYAAQVVSTRTEGNRTIGGRPAYLSPTGTTLELLGLRKAELVADFGWPGDGQAGSTGFTEADATTLLAGVRLAKDPTRPSTWP